MKLLRDEQSNREFQFFRSQIILLVFFCLPASSLVADPWPDSVVSVVYGTGAGFGQDFYPGNILGPPDPSASFLAPSSQEEELLTLGSGGIIVLSFHDGGIRNEAGPDFTIFENPFYPGNSNTSFAETGIVAVSIDGENWYEFYYDSETFSGLAGVTPVDGSADPLNPDSSGGDAFDLSDVGLDLAFYLRITDSEGIIQDSGPSFDLDAVAVIHGEDELEVSSRAVIPSTYQFPVKAYPNPFNSQVSLEWENKFTDRYTVTIFDAIGQKLIETESYGSKWSWDAGNLSSGTYYVLIKNNAALSTIKQITLIR